MLLPPFQLYTPSAIDEAARIAADHPGSRILAGGTFLITRLKQMKQKGLKTPGQVISLRRVKELSGIRMDGAALSIGAMTTLTELAGSAEIQQHLPVLGRVGAGIGTTQIRNMGTVGGNLTCRYTWTELAALMISLDAGMSFFDRQTGEQSIPASDFFAAGARHSEIATRVTVPLLPGIASSYVRVSKTPGVDIPLLAVAARAVVRGGVFADARVVLNTGMRFPTRLTVVEETLNGQPLDAAVIAAGVAAFSSQDPDPSADEYKRHMYRVALKDALRDLLRAASEEI